VRFRLFIWKTFIIITVDAIFVYLCQQESWISDVQIAAELDSSMPVTRKLLVELGDVVESDGDGNWRVVKTATTEVEIVTQSSNELTISEEKELLTLERRVERGFYMAGKALLEIRNKRLYREQYKTFSDYCQARFSFSYRNANYLIVAVEVMDNLLTNVSSKMGSNASQKNLIQLLPTSTRQTLPLSKLPAEQQLPAWQKAVSVAPNGKPSGKLVSQVVKEIQNQEKEKEKMDDFLTGKRQAKTSSNNRREGLNYKPGNNGCEWFVKVEQSTYKQLKDYQEQNGLPTLNSAISSLLSLINH
jgi:hypothetical protein